jgi:GTP cyclohydrolase I
MSSIVKNENATEGMARRKVENIFTISSGLQCEREWEKTTPNRVVEAVKQLRVRDDWKQSRTKMCCVIADSHDDDDEGESMVERKKGMPEAEERFSHNF